ncbi:MAG: DUF6778 family protein [Pseudomonadota bacterium]
MKRAFNFGALGVVLLVAGCVGATSNGQIGGESVPFLENIQASADEVDSWTLGSLNLVIPEELRVSTNPNAQFPREEIVWWGDPDGDRREQVRDIMTRSLMAATQTLDGSKPVDMTVRLALFHAVTPRARRGMFFAWHDVSYAVDVRDSATGELLASIPKIDADLEALRGEQADLAVERGQTQRVRISRRIARVTRDWLASSGASLAQPGPVYKIEVIPATLEEEVASQ